MRRLEQADISTFRDVRFVLTDMDETLTYQGRLAAETYAALENLQAAGIKVIPVTAAPAGWCDQMARMWPVDGVVGENGGFFFRRCEDGHRIERHFWHDDKDRSVVAEQLAQIGRQVHSAVPSASFADDQPFRPCLCAAPRCEGAARASRLLRPRHRSQPFRRTLHRGFHQRCAHVFVLSACGGCQHRD